MNADCYRIIALVEFRSSLWAVLAVLSPSATQRLVQWQCAQLPGRVPGVGMIPRLWRTADGLLQTQDGLQLRGRAANVLGSS